MQGLPPAAPSAHIPRQPWRRPRFVPLEMTSTAPGWPPFVQIDRRKAARDERSSV